VHNRVSGGGVGLTRERRKQSECAGEDPDSGMHILGWNFYASPGVHWLHRNSNL